MAYQVIARKWRPQTFEEVTGQEHITRTLRNAVEHERLHHAYLFSGARGVGKTTTARLLAKAVNCHRSEGPTPLPCKTAGAEACASCREIAEGRSIDVLEIDAASNTGVDNVREAIINTVGVRPARDRYKVFIIDEVHMLSGAAFNALLKTLEEPPPRVLFILATTESHRVPATILSRCQQFEFRTIAAQKIAERLRLIADAEEIKVTDEALREVARAGEGSMRDAQSAFDQVISFSEGAIEAPDVEAALGLAGSEMLSRVMRAVAGQRPADALAVVDDLVMRGHELRNFCRDLLAHLRDLLVVKVAGEGPALSDATESERRELAASAADFSESDLVRFFHSLTETEKALRESAHPRYQLEIGLVKLVEMRRLAPLGRIVERLNALEEAVRTGRAPAAGPGAETPPAAPAAGGQTRRGGAAGGSGPASFSATVPATPTTPAPTEVAPAVPPSEAFSTAAPPSEAFASGAPASEVFAPAPASSAPTPVAEARTPAAPPARPAAADAPPQVRPAAPDAAPPKSSGSSRSFASEPPKSSEPPKAFGAGRPAASAASKLKLVPPPPGAVPSEAPPEEAPFALGDEGAPEVFRTRASAEPPRAFEAESSRAFEAGPPEPQPPSEPEPTDAAGRIKRALEERNKPLLATLVEGARRVVAEGDGVRFEFAPEQKHLHDTLKKNLKLLHEVCCEALGRAVGVQVCVGAAGGEDADAFAREDEDRREQRRLRELAEENPLVKMVLKQFRGEIVEVRRAEAAQREPPPQAPPPAAPDGPIGPNRPGDARV